MEFFLGFLEAYYGDPRIFLSILFVYSILTAIALPIPVELALVPPLLPPIIPILGLALAIGLGKLVGAGTIFAVGLKVEAPIRYWCARHPAAGRIVGYVTRFVRVTKWFGLFFLLSIPLFPDTLPIYIYSLFNKQGQLISARIFLLVNFLAGINRAFIFLALWTLGIRITLG